MPATVESLSMRSRCHRDAKMGKVTGNGASFFHAFHSGLLLLGLAPLALLATNCSSALLNFTLASFLANWLLFLTIVQSVQ